MQVHIKINRVFLKLLFIGFTIACTMNANAQKCKFEKNEIDDMTGKQVVVMKEERIYKKLKMSGPESVKLSIRNIEGVSYLYITSYLQSDAYSIEEGETVIIKFKDDSILKLENFNSQVADYKKLGLSGSSTQWYATHKIILSEEDIEILKEKPISKIRLYATDGYNDFKIKKKNSSILQRQCKCIELEVE